MGLCLCVGLMADLKENDSDGFEEFKNIFARLNQALDAEGFRHHHEPEAIKAEDFVSFDMYGYSGLHYLRRVAAHLACSGELPSPGNDKASADPILEQYYSQSIGKTGGLWSLFKKAPVIGSFEFNHLIQHSDCEGFYVPIDFTNVIFPDSALKIPGEMIGSAQKLLRECERLAAALEIPRDMGAESDELWEAADSQGQGSGWRRYGVESFTCVRLLRACEAAIRSGATLVFA